MSSLPLFEDDANLFGSTRPAHIPPTRREDNANAGIGDLDRWAREEPKEKRAKPVKPPDEPALRKIQELHPGKYGKVEKTITMLHSARGRGPSFEGGFMKTQDLWGFLDFAGVSRGQFIGLQTTTRASIAAHLRGFTNPTNTHGAGAISVETHLREFLAMGGIFYIAGLWQEGGKGSKWNVEIVKVTSQLLDEYKSRKRTK